MINSRILVVDDEPSNAAVVARALGRAGYRHVKTCADGTSAIAMVDSWKPQLLILDLHMRDGTGFDVLAGIRGGTERSDVMPILVMTADVAPESLRRSRGLGADDYLLKPFHVNDLLFRVEGLLTMSAACAESRGESKSVRGHIAACRHLVTQAELDLLGQVTGTSERDDRTDGHCVRVGELAGALARQLRLDDHEVAAIRAAAPLHDIGKVAISDRILYKVGPLSDHEREIVGRHTVIGGYLLSGTQLPLVRLAHEIALYHHERWDGTGYPRGRAGEEIPLSARIVAVADVFDALTSVRSYKRAWPVRAALTEIISKSGTQFDPRMVGALVATVLRRDTRVAASDSDDSVLSLVERQRQREAQIHAAIAAGKQLQRAGFVRDVFRRAIVA